MHRDSICKVIIGLVVFSLCLGTTLQSCVANTAVKEQELAELYAQFLDDGNRACFVAFEREMLVPKPQQGEQLITLKDGRTARLHPYNKYFFAFLRDHTHFLIACSHRMPLTNEDGLMSADELHGYDGQDYWTLELSSPVKIYIESTNASGLLPPTLSFNPLTIIPKVEADNKRQRYQSDIEIAAVRGLWAECLSVVQFGWSDPLESPPRLSGRKLTIVTPKRRSTIGQIIGNSEQPSAISFNRKNLAGNGITAAMNYRDDALVVSRFFHTNLFFRARYRILAFKQLRFVAGSTFSWRAYKDRAGNVLGTLLTNGATMQVKFTNGAVVPVRLLASAKPLPRHSKVFIYLLFALVTVGAVILAWNNKKNRKNDATIP